MLVVYIFLIFYDKDTLRVSVQGSMVITSRLDTLNLFNLWKIVIQFLSLKMQWS